MCKSGTSKVYAFDIYDIGADEMRRSRRMATPEAIAAIGGAPPPAFQSRVGPG
jgi:hypothetical protein